jgi:hypothetical protein
MGSSPPWPPARSDTILRLGEKRPRRVRRDVAMKLFLHLFPFKIRCWTFDLSAMPWNRCEANLIIWFISPCLHQLIVLCMATGCSLFDIRHSLFIAFRLPTSFLCLLSSDRCVPRRRRQVKTGHPPPVFTLCSMRSALSFPLPQSPGVKNNCLPACKK